LTRSRRRSLCGLYVVLTALTLAGVDVYGASLILGRPGLTYGLSAAALAVAAADTLVGLVALAGRRWACAFAAVATFWVGFTHLFLGPFALYAVEVMMGLEPEFVKNAGGCGALTGCSVFFVASLRLSWGEEVLKQSRLAAAHA
jgi:hypothetical protein